MSSSVALRVEIAALGFQHAQVGDDAGGGDVLVLAGGSSWRADLCGAERAQVFEFVAIFLQRMAGDEEAENFLFVGEALCVRPSREYWEACSCGDCVSSCSNTPNRPCWPDSASRCAFWARSMARSRTAMSCARRPSESMAPLLISDSSTRLFSRRRSTFSQNSKMRVIACPASCVRRRWTRWRCGRRSLPRPDRSESRCRAA